MVMLKIQVKGQKTKDKENVNFYFKNLILPFNATDDY